MARPLNPKQLKFVELYLATGNATQSYIDAGYKGRGRSATNAASRMLAFDGIKEAIDRATNRAVQTAELTAGYVIAGLKREAEYMGDGTQHAARVKAYELLGKAVRLFPDEAKAAPNTNVNVTVISPDERARRIDALRSRIAALGGGGAAG